MIHTERTDKAVKDFHHPFHPYDIQQRFMLALHDCIEQGQVGIFESPTGTGKSLSLICGSLTWLREHKRKQFDEALAAIKLDDDDDEPDWISNHATEMKKQEIRHMRADFEARLMAVRDRERTIRQRQLNNGPPHKRLKQYHQPKDSSADEEQFVLDEYNSDSEQPKTEIETTYSVKTTELMGRLGMLPKLSDPASEIEVPEEMKIFFCSRTHSQLSQFVGELKRVNLPPGWPPEHDQGLDQSTEDIKHLTLGSRKNLCINPKVSKLRSQTAVNERCIELQQSSTAAEHKCAFLPNKDTEDIVLDFRDHALARIRDIEDLANVGSRLQICPYYASRPAIGPAEIVTLPYPLLLLKTAREALGISLKDHVVIIDEAHNLMDAIEGIHSTQISSGQLEKSRSALLVYLQRFRNRLKGSNRTYLTQLVRVIDSLLRFTTGVKDGFEKGDTIKPAELLVGKGVDQVNLSKLMRYVTESKLARKVEGYISTLSSATTAVRGQKGHADDRNESADIPTLSHVQNFLMALTNRTNEGKFLWAREEGTIILRYLLLDPSEHFRDVVEDARAVILAGGTMSPMDDYKQQLFPYLPTTLTFSCGHLVPPSSLFVRAVSADDSGRLDFSFKRRTEGNALRLGSALIQISPQVQGGLVIFFPSYGYLESVMQTLEEKNVLQKLEHGKPIFRDNRNTPAEETFQQYSEAVRTKGSATLFSVIGGKLSEGINFSDDLGRCVMVVGLPYPNLETPEWKAKMQYLDDRAIQRGDRQGKASREHAENVCMRSVNQAIGRAIRHKNDWASILLFDARYTNGRIEAKLPGWIRESYRSGASGKLEDVVGDLTGFFKTKNL